MIQGIDSESNYFTVGMFSNHPAAGNVPLALFITTGESEPVNVTVTSYNEELITGLVNPRETTEILLPDSFMVSNVSDRYNGLIVQADKEKKVSVTVSNHHYYSSDSYLALPLIEYHNVSEYIYYAVTPHGFNSTSLKNRVLLVGGFNRTNVTITPTQLIHIPPDLSPNGELYELIPFERVTLELNQFETLLLESEYALTGTKVVTNRPITFLSGHQCAALPKDSNRSCDFAIEQFPPTLNWGKTFLLPVLSSRPGGSYLSILASEEDTNVTVTCYTFNRTQNLSSDFVISSPGDFSTMLIAPDDVYCSVVSNKPTLLTILSTSENYDTGDGDPLMLMVHPVEQYSIDEFTFTADRRDIGQHYLNLMVQGNTSDISLDDEPLSVNWAPIFGVNEEVIGYGAQLGIANTTHTVSVRNNSLTRVGAMVYGFNFSVGYGHLPATKLLLVGKSPFHEYYTQIRNVNISV